VEILEDESRYFITLEAFADTFVPGEKRFSADIAIAGAAPGAGAVTAGAIDLLHTSATGISEILADLVIMLNEHAAEYAAANGVTVIPGAPPFAALGFADRSELARSLTAPGHPEKEFWVLAALFCFMAFDTAAHMDTVSAMRDGHPGLTTIGFAAPDADGLWRFPDFSYGRQLARVHPGTVASGDPA
jgi:enediyne biosynthesis protein E8